MAVTLNQLELSKDEQLVNYLYLNSAWLMSTWQDNLDMMAKRAHKITSEILQDAEVSTAIVDRENKDNTKQWTELSVKIITPIGVLVFGLPASWEGTDAKVISALTIGKIFAPKGQNKHGTAV